jgi:hypothetical protein
VESHPILQRGLALRWLEKRRVNYREALLYFWATQIQMSYIQDTKEQLTPSGPDNDIQAYVRLLNFGWVNTPNQVPATMDVAYLKARTNLNIVNPFAFYSIYVALVTYMWEGNESAPLPMLEIGPVDYLPMLRTAWTPFGLEYHMENYLRIGERSAMVDFQLGDNAFHSGWGGLGVQVQRIVDDEELRIDGSLRLWQQPDLISGFPVGKVLGGGLGGSFTLRAYQDIPGLPFPIHAVGEVGYKSVGFVEGYPMDASPLVMLGISWVF